MARIDLNADLGEGFGAYGIGDDDAMLDIITSANIACGFHGGDPVVMHRTMQAAKARGVAIGAHPGFDDLRGFGRRRIEIADMGDVEKMLVYQIGAAEGMARACGAELRHYKIHGALSNMACTDAALAMAVARAMKAVAPHLVFVVLPRSELEKAGEKLDLAMAREIFADRAYDDDGMLVARSQEGAMISDAKTAADRMAAFVADGAVQSISGKRIAMPMETICVHGDSKGAVAIAKAVRDALVAAGIEIAAMTA